MIFYYLCTALTFLSDTYVKNKVDKEVEYDKPKEIFSGKLLLRKYYNKGFALNGLDKHPSLVAAFSAFLTVLLALFAPGIYRKYSGVAAKAGYALMLGGALSNTSDRVIKRHVVDYFSFNVKCERLRRVIFNISDFAIFIGSMLFIIFLPEKEN